MDKLLLDHNLLCRKFLSVYIVIEKRMRNILVEYFIVKLTVDENAYYVIRIRDLTSEVLLLDFSKIRLNILSKAKTFTFFIIF